MGLQARVAGGGHGLGLLAGVFGWAGLGWESGGRVVGVVRSKNFYGFVLCSPFLTYTPSFIQIGPKLAKLVLWGGLGGGGRGVWVVGSKKFPKF